MSNMSLRIGLIIALALAGTGAGFAKEAEPMVFFGHDGLFIVNGDATGKPVGFGAAQVDIAKLAAKGWGAPAESGTMGECGAGPIDFLRFDNGATLHFQDEMFVGWAVNQEGTVLVRPGDFGIGSPFSDAEAVLGDTSIIESTLGSEFAFETLFGIVSDPSDAAVIEALWSGVSCNFR